MFKAVAQDVVVATPPVVVEKDHNAGYIGARYHATFSNFDLRTHDGGLVSTSFVLGHGWGGEMGFYFSRHFAMGTEVMFNKLAEDFETSGNVTRRVRLDYFNVPLLLIFNTNSMSPVNLNIHAGPQIGFNTHSSITTIEREGEDELNAVLSVKKNDVGVAYGAGLDFLLGETLKLGIGYRGFTGLVDISDDSQNLTTDDYLILHRSHVKTNAAYASLGFAF
jgi:opacity protein-like surface antigen